jgi:hypothetical protein
VDELSIVLKTRSENVCIEYCTELGRESKIANVDERRVQTKAIETGSPEPGKSVKDRLQKCSLLQRVSFASCFNAQRDFGRA